MQIQTLPALLSQRCLLPGDMIESCLAQARQQQLPFISLLIRSTPIDTRQLAALIAEAFACPLFDLDALDHQWQPPALAPELMQALLQRRLLPLSAQGGVVQIAVADPAALSDAGRELQRAKFSLQPVIVDMRGLDSVLVRLSQPAAPAPPDWSSLLEDEHNNEEFDNLSTATSSEESPVVRFLNEVLRDAVRHRASDIHIEPFEDWCRIRFRIDGLLNESVRVPARFAPRLSSRLKVMAELDITERRRPQDGRLSIRASDNRTIDLRLSTLPTLWGEKIVLRIMGSMGAIIPLAELGCSPQQRCWYQQALDRHQGLVLVTGPTGSGKTVTLYSGLSYLNAAHRNIATAEDPVEINLEGINQVAVNHRSGLDFASCLRAFLRQDPDVVMIGEIRDLETADMAIKAAQTGHLVLSTLHTNSASETVGRLLTMGIDSWNLASALSLVIAQRLVRKLCPHCRMAQAISDHDRLRFAGLSLPDSVWSAKGCTRCHQGYRGRVAIMEMLPITTQVAELIGQGCQPVQLSQLAAAAGWPGLNDNAIDAVSRGETTLDEVHPILRGLAL